MNKNPPGSRRSLLFPLLLGALLFPSYTCCAIGRSKPLAQPQVQEAPAESTDAGQDPASQELGGARDGIRVVAPWEIKPGDKRVRLALQGEIDDDMAKEFEALASVLPVVGVQGVWLEINSPGGDVEAGFRIVKAMERSGMKFECLVDGKAASEAFYVFQACDKRWMTRRSWLMAHEPYGDVRIDPSDTPTDIRVDRKFLEQQRKRMDLVSRQWAEHAAAKMKISVSRFLRKIREGDWFMFYDEALKYGAVDGAVTGTNRAWLAFKEGK